MFFGTFEHTLDKKGRISLPARFREILSGQYDGKLVLTTNMDPEVQCLTVYPVQLWKEFVGDILALSPFQPHVVRLKRLVVASACEASMDKQGRVLIPTHLRKYGELDHDAVWAGMGGSIELWNRDLWKREHEEIRKDLRKIVEAVDEGRKEK